MRRVDTEQLDVDCIFSFLIQKCYFLAVVPWARACEGNSFSGE